MSLALGHEVSADLPERRVSDHYFVSYSSVDAGEFTLRLADALAAGPPSFRVWVDRRRLRPGEDWDEQLDEAIRDCRALLFVMTRDSVRSNSGCKHEWARALRYQKPVVPLRLDAEAELPLRLGSRQFVDFTGSFETGLARLRRHLLWLDGPEGRLQALRDRLADAERERDRVGPVERARIEAEIDLLREQIERRQWEIAESAAAREPAESRADGAGLVQRAPCPYRGLQSFRERDADVFFGRDGLTTWLVDSLERSPLTAVVGPSGSGKSSLVFAGALPRLRQRPGWAVAELRPATATSPLAALAAGLLPLLEPAMTETQRLREITDLEAVLAERRLAEVAGRALARVRAGRLLLVVDQFEELFGFDHKLAGPFIDVLLAGIGQRPTGRPTVTVALTLRADFLGRALEHAELARALQGNLLLVGRMSRDELRAVVEGPARGLVRFESGLVDRVLDDVRAEPGSLALLEFALTLLWDQQTNGLLTHAAYESLGRVDGALAGYAEQVYRSGLLAARQDDARRLFVQLVRPGEATEHTRRVARRSELDAAQWQVAQDLAVTRLVVMNSDETSEETVEVAHEALINTWPRLRDWVAADHAFRTWQERVRTDVADWQRTGRDPGGLLRGLALAEAQSWLKQRPADVSAAERGFIEASRLHEQRSLRRLRALAGALVMLLVVSVGVGIQAVRERARAQDRDAESTSRYLASQAEKTRALRPHLSILLSVQAYKIRKTEEARDNLLGQLHTHRETTALLAADQGGALEFPLAFSRTGALLASGGRSGATVWHVARRRRVGGTITGPRRGVTSLDFGGTALAFGGEDDERVFLWDAASRKVSGPPLSGHAKGVSQLIFAPDGRRLLVLSKAGEVTLWDTVARSRLATAALAGRVLDIAFDRTGRPVAAVKTETALVIRDVVTRRLIGPAITLLPSQRRPNGADDTTGFFLSPDAHRAILVQVDKSRPDDTGDFDNYEYWDLISGRRLSVFDAGADDGSEANATFSPDGKTIVFNDTGTGAISVFDISTSTRPTLIYARSDFYYGVRKQFAIASIGILATYLSEGAGVRLTALDRLLRPPHRTAHTTALAADPTNERLALGGADGSIVLWAEPNSFSLPPQQSQARFPTCGDCSEVRQLDFGRDGRVLASLTRGGQLSVWDSNSRKLLGTHQVGRIDASMALHPDETVVAFGGGTSSPEGAGGDRRLYLWNVSGQGNRPRLVISLEADIVDLAYSDSGRWLAAATADGVIVWNTRGYKEVRRIRQRDVSDIDFYGQDHLVVAAGNQVLMWDLSRSGHEKVRLAWTNAEGISNMALTPTGKHLALNDFDGVTIIENLDKAAGTTSHIAGAFGTSLTFSRDGRSLMWVDLEVIRHLLNLNEGIEWLCRVAGRDLSDAEWREFPPGRAYERTCPRLDEQSSPAQHRR